MPIPRIPKQWLTRLINLTTKRAIPQNPIFHHTHITTPLKTTAIPFARTHLLSSQASRFDDGYIDDPEAYRAVDELLAEVEREKHLEREAKKRAGLEIEENEEEEDFMGAGELIERLEKQALKESEEGKDGFGFEEETEEDDDGDDRFEDGIAARRRVREREVEERELLDKKFAKHGDLINNFANAETHSEAHKWMSEIDKFKQKHCPLRPEYRVISEMMNRLKQATGKEKFLLIMKLNRAIRMVEL
ncbi:hypothetical protein AKJ16_DCAP22651 [Drosera capensis]